MLLLRVIFSVIAFLLALSLFRPVLSEHYAKEYESGSFRTEDTLLRASRITPEDARYPYLLGLFYCQSQDTKGIEKAIKAYRLSLERNPTDSQTWLALARSYGDYGATEDAAFALKKAVDLDKNAPALLWEAGVFSLSEGKVLYASQLFRRYIYIVPEEQENVYSLFHSMKVDSGYILENLVPRDGTSLRRYLNFVIANKLLHESAVVWERMKAYGLDRKDYIEYCNFLIGQGEIRDALGIWNEFVKKFKLNTAEKQTESLIWNGDFELPMENGGFDWRLGKADGVRVFRDHDIKKTGDVSLSAHFDGKHNPDISIIYQIVPVEPGKSYKLAGFLKTDKITTTNGVFFEVAGHLCEPFVKRSESITDTNLWRKMEIEFVTPKDCRTVVVGVRREKSVKFDNKIAGDVWIDSLSMD
jgi:tetratricopeptide (TPR) repeat protein